MRYDKKRKKEDYTERFEKLMQKADELQKKADTVTTFADSSSNTSGYAGYNVWTTAPNSNPNFPGSSAPSITYPNPGYPTTNPNIHTSSGYPIQMVENEEVIAALALLDEKVELISEQMALLLEVITYLQLRG